MEALAATFVLGLGSAASPCLLPLYPGFIAYLAATRSSIGVPQRASAALLGLAVLAGLLTTMILLGVTVTILALPMGDLLRYSIPVGTAVLVVLGLLLLAGRNPFERLVGVPVPVVRHPLGQAYAYGLVAGPLALPCAGPFLVALLAISIGVGESVTRIGSFVVYGLGFGLPLVALGALGAARGQAVSRAVSRHHTAILRASGAFLIVAAVYGVVTAGLV
jgi:cytochrome c-type biogenesis protein